MLYLVLFAILCVLAGFLLSMPKAFGSLSGQIQAKYIYFQIIVIYIVLIWLLVRRLIQT
ncbi:MAG: hypothetical protein HF314_04555 [Ignavibacteria bacterium]|nr:hypothetical protein [Ignavibacteria bacterium]MCU7502322.1 hypothetical protein [Ignavibacteria bacterium]MCU7518501.1 hypothetical protein [Ignavibacteria bacterium]